MNNSPSSLIVPFEELSPEIELVSVNDMGMFLNLMYHDLVDQLLEYITVFTDEEMIQEIINTLHLNIKTVVESTNHGKQVKGYITKNGVLV